MKFVWHKSLAGLVVCVLLLSAGCSKEARLESTLRKAAQFSAAGEYEAAEIVYLKALMLEPTNAVAIGRLGQIYFYQGRVLMGRTLLERANTLSPGDPSVRLTLGLARLSSGEYQAAHADALYVLKQQPTNDAAFLLLADSSRDTSEDGLPSMDELERFRSKAESCPGFHLALGSLYLRQGDQTNAVASIEKAMRLAPDYPDAHAAMGNVYLRQRNLEQAEHHLKLAAELDVWRSPRRMGYAEFKFRTGDPEEGKRLLIELLENVPDFIPAWIRLAEQGFSEKQLDKAREFVNEALRLDSANYDARLLSGRLCLAQEDADGGLHELDRLERLFPDAPALHYCKGVAYALKGDTASALAALSIAVERVPAFHDAGVLKATLEMRVSDYTSAIRSLRRLMEAGQLSDRVMSLLTQAYREQGNMEEAISACQQWMQFSPRDPRAPFTLGSLLLQQRSFSEARTAFDKALRLQPGFLPAHEELVTLDVREGRFDAALERATELILQMPESPGPLLLRARVQTARNDLEAAEASVRQAMAIDPENSFAYLIQARIQTRASQFEAAVESLKRAVALEPDNRMALMQLGALQQQLEDYPSARATYGRLLDLDPDNGPALNNLAYIHADHFGDFEKAYECGRRALEKMPEDANALDTLGWICFMRGDYRRACFYLDASTKKLPGRAEIWFHAGMSHYMLLEEGLAQVAFERAFKMDDEFEARPEIARRLAILEIQPRTASKEAEALLYDEFKRDPDDPVVLMKLAAIHERDGEFELAVQRYQAAAAISTESPAPLMALARIHAFTLNDLDTGFEYARTARKLAPDDPLVAHLLGRTAFLRGDHLWSSSLLKESAQATPDNPSVWYDLAWSHLSLGQVSDAVSELTTSIDLDPASPEAVDTRELLALCRIIEDSSGIMSSTGLVQQTLSRDPAHLAALYLSGFISQEQGDTNAAMEKYERILSADKYPLFAPAQRQLSILLVEDDPTSARALELARGARASLPNDPAVLRVLGVVLFHQQDYKGSVRFLNEAIDIHSGDPELHFYLGMAFLKLNDNNAARSALKTALELGLDTAHSVEANEALARLNR